MADSNQSQSSQKQSQPIEALVEWQQLELGKFAVFGTLFTSAVDTLLFPFDLVKTRLQVQGQVSNLIGFSQL
jgi:peptide subunit release factor 1 (eRF1)